MNKIQLKTERTETNLQFQKILVMHPKEGHWKFQEGRIAKRQFKILKGKHEAKGVHVCAKRKPVERVWIFSGIE